MQEQSLNAVKLQLLVELCPEEYSQGALDGEEFERLCAEIRRSAGDAIRRGNTTENGESFERALTCLRNVGSALYCRPAFSHKGKEFFTAVLEVVDGYPPTVFQEYRETALSGLADIASREAGEHGQAVAFYRKLLELEGLSLGSYAYYAYQVGSILTIDGELDEAIKFLESMIPQLRLKETQGDQGFLCWKLEPEHNAHEEIKRLSILLAAVFLLSENIKEMELSVPEVASNPDTVLSTEAKRCLELFRSKAMEAQFRKNPISAVENVQKVLKWIPLDLSDCHDVFQLKIFDEMLLVLFYTLGREGGTELPYLCAVLIRAMRVRNRWKENRDRVLKEVREQARARKIKKKNKSKKGKKVKSSSGRPRSATSQGAEAKAQARSSSPVVSQGEDPDEVVGEEDLGIGAEECSICLMELEKGEQEVMSERILACRHKFHQECLSHWLQRCEAKGWIPTCPYCRSETQQ